MEEKSASILHLTASKFENAPCLCIKSNNKICCCFML